MRTDHLNKSAKAISAKKRTHKRWMRVVSTLAAITVFCTTYALILPAITISANTHCGLEEHEHTDECYERQLVCGFDEDGNPIEGAESAETEAAEPTTEIVTESVLVDAGHIHDESCYNVETVLTCENTEEDHEHTEACYEEVRTLVCGEEEREPVYEEREVEVAVEAPAAEEAASETAHVHTDECYDKVLICEKEEHKHTDECRADKEADLETAEVWERTLPEKSEMKDEWKKDTLLVAQSQIGYKESEANFVVVNEERKGYTRYGEMFGVPYGDWCAMFLQFSLHYAGVDTRAMVGSPSVPLWVEAEIENENFYKVGDKIKDEETGEEKEYMPKATDIIFFDWEGDESPDHIGIIEEVKKDDDGKIESIITIEGNSQNEVRRNTYKPDNEHIFGYAEIPDKMTEEELQALAEGRKLEKEEAEAAEAEKQEKKEYVGVDGTLIVDEDDYTVTVSYTAEAGIPENASLKVVEIMQDADEYSIYNDKAAEEVYGHAEALPYARFFDITILDEEGLEVEPVSTVSVVIDTKDDILNTKDVEFAAVHFVDESKKAGEDAATVAPAPAPEATEEMSHAGSMEEVTQAIQQAEYVQETTTVVNPEAITTTTMDITTDQVVAFDTDGFSVYGVVMYYTVDFYYVQRTETTPAGSYFDLIAQGVKDAVESASSAGEGEATEGEETVEAEETAAVEEVIEGEEPTFEYTEYHMPGGTTMLMSDLFTQLEIERSAADIVDVEFTNTELVDFEEIEGDYNIISLQPFLTYEKLTITFNNDDVIEIDVTDAWDSTSSTSYRIRQTKDSDIPYLSELNAIIKDAQKKGLNNITVDILSQTLVDESVLIPSGMTVTLKGNVTLFRQKGKTITGPYIEVDNNATLNVQNLTFSGVSGEKKNNPSSNGTKYIIEQSDSQITSSNTKVRAGGTPGIFIGSNGTTTITNCNFYGINSNQSASGPATGYDTIAGYGLNDTAPIYANGGSLTITGGSIYTNYLNQNPSLSTTAGAIIANCDSTVSGVTIKDNVANKGMIVHDGGTASISSTTIDNNRINGSDAAPVVSKSGSTMTMTDTKTTNNIAAYPHWQDDGKVSNGLSIVDKGAFNTFFTNMTGTSLQGGNFNRIEPYNTTNTGTYPKGGFFFGDSTPSTGDESTDPEYLSSQYSSTGYLDKDPFRTAGALLVDGGTVTMKGSSEMNNNLADHGAVLVTNGGTFTMESGEIKGNKGYHAGAVAIASRSSAEPTSTFNFTGGTISDNASLWFGTINVSETNSRFTMGTQGGNPSGAVIKDNFTLHKGGAVYVNSSNTAIMSGKMENNTAAIFGGGIYLERYRTMKLEDAIVTNNAATSSLTSKAGVKFASVSGGDETGYKWDQKWWSNLGSGLGGGVWSCPTGRTVFNNREVAIYNNTAHDNGGQDFSIRDHADELTFRTDEEWKMEKAPNSPNTIGNNTTDNNPTDPKYIPTSGRKELRFTNNEGHGAYDTVQNPSGYSLIITNNEAPCGGGIASNGDMYLVDEIDERDITLKFKKEYPGGAWNGHDVKITVTLENTAPGANPSKVYEETKEITEANKNDYAVFELPVVWWDTYNNDIYKPEKAYAYDALIARGNSFAVGTNDLDFTKDGVENKYWKLKIREQVKINGAYVDVTPDNEYYNAQVSTESETSNNNQNQLTNSVIHQVTYEAQSTITNIEKTQGTLTVAKVLENSGDADSGKVFWFDISIYDSTSGDGFNTSDYGVYYTIYNSSGAMNEDYTYIDGATVVTHSKGGVKVDGTTPATYNGQAIGATNRVTQWGCESYNSTYGRPSENANTTKYMSIPLKAGEHVIFSNLPVGATWKVRERSIDDSHYEWVKYENITATNGTITTNKSNGSIASEITGTISQAESVAHVRTTNKAVGTVSLTKKINGGNNDPNNDQFWFTGYVKSATGTGYNTVGDDVTFTIYNADGTVNTAPISIGTETSNPIDTSANSDGRRATRAICNGTSVKTDSIRFPLEAGQTIVFNNVPVGSEWAFKEELEANTYEVSYSGGGETQTDGTRKGSITSGNKDVTVTANNEFNGDFSITKEVVPANGTGTTIYGNDNLFWFDVTLKDSNNNIINSVKYQITGSATIGSEHPTADSDGNRTATSTNGAYSIPVKAGQTIKFVELPLGTKVTATESTKVTINGTEKVMGASGSEYTKVKEQLINGETVTDITSSPYEWTISQSTNHYTVKAINQEVTNSFTLTKEVVGGGTNNAKLYGDDTLFEFVGSITKADGTPLSTSADRVTFSILNASGTPIEDSITGFSTVEETCYDNETIPNSGGQKTGAGNRRTYYLGSSGNTSNMSFKLKAGQSIRFNNLPIGASWSIKEVLSTDAANKYDVEYFVGSEPRPVGADGYISGTTNTNSQDSVVIKAQNTEKTSELELQKVVEGGTDADNNVEFKINVTVGEGTSAQTYTKKVKADGTTVKIENLPIGATWKAKEVDIPSGYTLKGYSVDGTEKTPDGEGFISGVVGTDLKIVATNKISSGKFELKKELKDFDGNVITPDEDVWYTFTGKIVGRNGNYGDDGGFSSANDNVFYQIYDENGVLKKGQLTNHGNSEDIAAIGEGLRRTGNGHLTTSGNKTNAGMSFKLKAGWKIVFVNLPPGAKAEFTETGIPQGTWLQGYTINETPSEANKAEVTIVAGQTASVVATNEKRAPQLKIKKVDAANHETTLTGALFRLKSSDAVITDYVNELESDLSLGDHNAGLYGQYGYGTTVLGTGSYQSILDSSVYALDGEGYSILKSTGERLTNSNGNYIRYIPRVSAGVAKIVAVDANGIGDLGTLKPGTYTLEELVAPRGYNKLSSAITITVSDNGTVSYSQVGNASSDSGSGIAKSIGEYDGANRDIRVLTVTNSSGQVLPNTGGIGTVIFTVLGAALVIGAAIALLATRKRRG